jgi:hypothetical protein
MSEGTETEQGGGEVRDVVKRGRDGAGEGGRD